MNRGSKISALITCAIAIVSLIVVILLNVAVSTLPSSYTHIDTTKAKLFTLTNWTQDKLNSLTKDVAVYYLCSGGIEDENISEILSKYTSHSDRITVTIKDTSVYPEFYSKFTDTAPTDNSLIVVCGERSICIDYYEIYQYSDSAYLFDGEGQITKAIDYVTTDYLPKLYTLEGHGESNLSAEILSLIQKENIEVESLSLNGLTAIPEDAACIAIYSPERDIAQAEKDIFDAYMSSGGKMMILCDYSEKDMPMLDSFISKYGLKIEQGIVLEEDSSNHVPNYPFFIYPTEVSHDITDPMIDAGLHTLFPLAGGITVTDDPQDSINISEFIKSSDTVYSKVNINSENLAKEESDISGPFAFAVEMTDSENESQLIMYSTSQFLDSNINSMVGSANYDLFLNSLTSLCKKEQTATLRAKEILSASVTVPEFASNIMFIVLVILLPITTVIIAITIVYIRRSR